MSSLELSEEDDFYVAVGDVVAGKYRVERVLGSGGMAFVLSARHVELDELFALKFLDRRFLSSPQIIERFTQEAKAACRIRSEHVARVYDVGTHDGAPFFVMEHLDGRDLATVIHEGGPLRVDEAVEYVMQACEALAVAHSHDVVHRDIKPENLFLVERGALPVIKVLDFGISRVALRGREPPSRLTGELTLGTPCYMSPEQIRSTAAADARSDQWSLGVVLYELLAGIEAFRADSINAVCAAVLEREPPPLLELRPDLPEELAEVVMKCLEKNPEHRFADVAELAAALLPFAPTRALVSAERSSSLMKSASATSSVKSGQTSVSRLAISAPVATPMDAVAHTVAPSPEPRRRSPIVVAAIAVCVMATGGLLAHGASGKSGPSTRHEAAAPAPAPPPPVAAVAPEPEPEHAVASVAVRTRATVDERAREAVAVVPRPAPRPAPPQPAAQPHRPQPSAETSAAPRPTAPAEPAAPPPSVELGY